MKPISDMVHYFFTQNNIQVDDTSKGLGLSIGQMVKWLVTFSMTQQAKILILLHQMLRSLESILELSTPKMSHPAIGGSKH